MSSSQNPSPSKNDETLPPQTATSPSYESIPQQITVAFPISTIFPEEITKRKKISAKKTTPKKSSKRTQSTSRATSASKQTGKKSKSTPKVVHTMRELYLDNPATQNVDVNAEASDSSKKNLSLELDLTETLGLEKPRSAEKLGETSLKTPDVAIDGIGATSKANFESEMTVDENAGSGLDAANDATASAAHVDISASIVPESPNSPVAPVHEEGTETTIPADVTTQNKGESVSVPDTSEPNVIDVESLQFKSTPRAGISRRLRSNTGKDIATPSEATKTKIGPKKQWSKVTIPSGSKKKTVKRKTISSSDSDYEEDQDAEASPVASPQKSAKRKRMAPNVPSVPIDNVSFHCVENVDRWKFVVKRRMAIERNLTEELLKCQDIVNLIEEAGLMKTVSELGKCYDKLTREFLVNIPADCDDPLSPEYLKVYVRGKCVDFSPAIINQHLGRCDVPAPELEISMNEVCKTITGDKVRIWPRAGKLSAAKLTTKYALLNKTGAANWVPTTHSNSVATGLAKFIYVVGTSTVFDYGTHIFNATILHGSSTAVKMPIAFPTLICGIILSQHPDICTNSDVPVSRPSALTMDFRLLEGTHAADIAVASLKKPAAGMTKRQMIANLREVSKMLGEKKELVDGVIQALELEQSQANEDGVGPSHGASHDDDLAGGDTVEEEMASDESPSI
ncbi:uncharacterized protein LOC123888927 [Trifolium pratense]|uniref:uncharacterized protein LOC123888927 n=1 Tax=Trifolium pratense TaxID=57577 RepID=UPI001E69188A|nr:uncharacterized protein LOC123888927 [Trifolium pratense]